MQLAKIFGWIVLAGTLASPAQAAEKLAGKPDRRVQVLSELHKGNLAEIAMGQLAQKNGGSQEVKDYGQKLVQDHQDADSQVLDLARTENLTLNEIQPTEKEKRLLFKLQGLSGKEFDKLYLSAMVKDHSQDLRMVSQAENRIRDEKVDALLSKLMPVLHQHHDAADSLRKAVRKTAG